MKIPCRQALLRATSSASLEDMATHFWFEDRNSTQALLTKKATPEMEKESSLSQEASAYPNGVFTGEADGEGRVKRRDQETRGNT